MLLHRLRDLADEAETILTDPARDLDEIGNLLHESWEVKKGLAGSVSSSAIDELYGRAMGAGALGGKLLGAGGGGFLLFYRHPEDAERLRTALAGLVEVRPGIDREGSRVVLYEPGGL